MPSINGYLKFALLLVNIGLIGGTNEGLQYANMLLLTWAIIATIGFSLIFILFLGLSLILTIIILKSSDGGSKREIISNRMIETKEGINLDSNC